MMTADYEIQCWKCTIKFAVPAESAKRRQERKETIRCPLCGEEICWPNYETKVEQLERRLKQETDSLTSMIDERDSWRRLAGERWASIKSLRSHVSRLRRQLDDAKGKRK